MSEEFKILLGNIVAGTGMVMLFASTHLQNKRQILGLQSINHILSIFAGLLLRGYSGVVQDVVSLARNLVVIFGRQTRFLKVFFVAAGVILGFCFNNRGIPGLLPIIASTEYALVVVSERTTERTLKIAIVISSLCWAVYSIYLLNFVNMAANVLTCASALYYIFKKPSSDNQGKNQSKSE